jgi:hypothetical protein
MAYRQLLNHLLLQNLSRSSLIYSPESRRHFFAKPDGGALVAQRDWFNLRTQKPARRPRSVAKYYKYGRDEFWRHHAVSLSIDQVGSSWYLKVIPRYHFTVDGETPWDPEKVGPYTTRIKSDEHNQQVLNHVFFWIDVLRRDKTSIDLVIDGRRIVSIDPTPLSVVAEFSITHDPVPSPPRIESPQGSLFATDLLTGEEDTIEI